MKALIDLDCLLYEVGHSYQKTTVVAGVSIVEPLDWELCKQGFDNKIATILGETEADEPPLLFLEGTYAAVKILNKQNKREGKPLVDKLPNFRIAAAVTKPYKGNRPENKPFHFKNLMAHAMATHEVYVVTEPWETDDAMCIYATQATRRGEQVVVCSRDKDVRQYEGWYYGWECGRQNAIGPIKIEGVGILINKNEGKTDPSTNKPLKLKVFGTGKKFFYYQMLTGDGVDNITGIMGRGPTFAYNLLKDENNERKLYELVAEVYVKTWGDVWEEKMKEMADLLWIIKDLNEEGLPIMWTKPEMDYA